MVGIVFIPRDMVSVDLLFIEDISGFEVAVVLCWISRISWSCQCHGRGENAKRVTLLKQKTETADRERENTIAFSRKLMRMREFGWSLLSTYLTIYCIGDG